MQPPVQRPVLAYYRWIGGQQWSQICQLGSEKTAGKNLNLQKLRKIQGNEKPVGWY
jgi:hypothetical protein